MSPHDVAIPVIFDDRFIGTDIEQMAVGQQSAPFVEIGDNLPGVDHSPVHVNKTDIISDFAFCPSLSGWVVA
ncbi:hypothetical protein ES703_117623 [subsurface metagenome]